jgi:hypothetical protein
VDSDKQIDLDYEEDEEDPLSPPSGEIQLNEGVEDELEDEGDDTDDTVSDEEQHENIEEDEEEKPRKSRLKGVSPASPHLCPLFPHLLLSPPFSTYRSLEDSSVSRTTFPLTPHLPPEEFAIGFAEKLENCSLLMESMEILVQLLL